MFSIIATSYNQAPFLEACLDSIRAQSDDSWQLVITDDASTDESRSIIEDWLDRTGVEADLVLPHQNLGLTTILNEALERCRGDWVVHVGCDDVLTPDRLEAHAAATAEVDASVAVIYSDGSTMHADGTPRTASWMAETGHLPAPEGLVFDRLLRGNFVLGCSATYRRRALHAVGGWSPDLPFEDWDLLLRLATEHRFHHVPAILSHYRIHPDSMMRRHFAELVAARLSILQRMVGVDPSQDAFIVDRLQDRSWQLFRDDPELGKPHVRSAYEGSTSMSGRLRRLAASDLAVRLAERIRSVRDSATRRRERSA